MDKVLSHTNNFRNKKNRVYLSTLLTGYHQHQTIFKEGKRNKKYNYG